MKELKTFARKRSNNFRASPTAHLFQTQKGVLTVEQYRKRFDQCVAHLGFHHPEFRPPHSARKTFYTLLTRVGVPKPEICAAGRWAQPDAAARYRVWDAADGRKLTKAFWCADEVYDPPPSFPGDIPPAVKRAVAPLIVKASDGIHRMLKDLEF